MTESDVDVAVVGAGVAGLAAARELRRRHPSHEIVVIEARDRIGGRIHTIRPPDLPLPIELGAEFLHGTAAETTEVAEGAGLTLYDVVGDRWEAHRGRLTQIRDFWKRLDAVMKRLDPEREPDRSFRDFIERRPGGRPLARNRALALEFVEGFHAADASRISERAVAEGGSPGRDPNELRMARVLAGYDRVPETLASPVREAVRLNTVVMDIVWKPGAVNLTFRSDASGDTSVIHARAAIITVPLGVLLAPTGSRGAIRFDPPVDKLLAQAMRLTMGSVLRIALHLRERFWENEKLLAPPAGQSLNKLTFLHSNDPDVPVWWTAHPVRAPLLIGWAGGPRATRLLAHSHEEIERHAIASLARQVGMSTRKLRGLVVESWMHNWDHDPFARGAYSYTLVGGFGAWSRLARPIDRTLYFAGEACDPDGQLGTVNGAIATGVRAAKLCTRALETVRAR